MLRKGVVMTKLVIALDSPNIKESFALVEKLSQHGIPAIRVALKVGLNTFIAGGPAFLRGLRNAGEYDLVLDLKLFDIPNTMVNAALQICDLPVQMFTVHASAGALALREVQQALQKMQNPPKMLAVTVLTSMPDYQVEAIFHNDIRSQIRSLAQQALGSADADGIVCSALDLPFINSLALRTAPFIRFIPGIELAPREDDQRRKASLRDAVENQADYVVVGRPIYQNDNPVDVVNRILARIEEIRQAMTTWDHLARWE
jgi:orotidine-5'-phosphate decarboxylase